MEESDLTIELENFRLAARRFEQLFQGLPIACLGFDLTGTIYEWNKAFERMLDCKSPDLLMSSIFTLLCLSDDQYDRMGDMLDGVARGESYESFEWKIGSADGVRHLLCSMLPKPGPNGTIAGAIFSGLDMTAQKKYEQQIESQLAKINLYSSEIEARRVELEAANQRLACLASTDGLTGLLNHRAFFDALEIATNPQGACRFPVSIVLLDVDDFKSYNDAYGHPAGDEVLRRVALALTAQTRDSDVVARYGGEEFVVLLANSSAEQAVAAAGRMRKAIEKTDWPLRPVTASFGVSTILQPTGAGAEFVALADRALYVSKRNGKNRVHHIGAEEQTRAA